MSFLKKQAASLRVAALIALGAVTFTGCATNNYVDEKIAAVNSRIDQVDARVATAAQRAEAANSAAASAASSASTASTAAQAAATDARAANQRIDQLGGRVDALERAPAKKPRG